LPRNANRRLALHLPAIGHPSAKSASLKTNPKTRPRDPAMRTSRYTLSTLKEAPADAEVASHQLLIRGGFIRKLASGLYNWMPIGTRVLHKVMAIVRDEMDRIGGQEVLMPVIQPAELWEESGRWQKYDEGQLLKFLDRHQREFCFGPTHEEVITDLARGELKSHKQLPATYYQIQTKFRDETRPRFGLLRAREFMMKDAYSFHLDQSSLDATYQDMHGAYTRILERVNVDFRPVQADSGSIGGNASMEFHVLAESGEDAIAFSDESDYAANAEMAEAIAPASDTAPPGTLSEVSTPDAGTIEDVCTLLGISAVETLKTLIMKGAETPLVALVLRGDHQGNSIKIARLVELAQPPTLASDEEIRQAIGCGTGSIGPVGLEMPVIVDRTAAACANFVCGANRDGFHYTNANWLRDANWLRVEDLRDVVPGDPSPDGKGTLQFARGIEVGHIFQLGDVYTRAMNATVLDDSGKARVMTMGCYGIGVSRLVAAIIEQHHDDKGMIWPASVAPFRVIIIPINAHKSDAVRECSEGLYADLTAQGIEVLLDDRDSARPGVKFADAELIGVPHRIVIGDRGLKNGQVEYMDRRTGEAVDLAVDEVLERVST